jgi:hypothetical protein
VTGYGFAATLANVALAVVVTPSRSDWPVDEQRAMTAYATFWLLCAPSSAISELYALKPVHDVLPLFVIVVPFG